MTYAQYNPAGQPPLAGSGAAVAQHPIQRDTDRIREAARTGLYRIIVPESDGTWTLRHLDDATGRLTEPDYVSERFIPGSTEAVTWASELTGISCWHGMSRPYRGAYIDEIFSLVRSIARQPSTGKSIGARIGTDPSIPDLTLLIVREHWHDTGLENDLYMCEYSGFADEADMLRQVSDWFGLDPTKWTTVTPGIEYRHP